MSGPGRHTIYNVPILPREITIGHQNADFCGEVDSRRGD